MDYTQTRKPNWFATFSLILGILAMVAFLNIYYSVLLGSLGLLFAHLSKGGSYRTPDRAIGGMATSIFGIVLSVVLTVTSVIMMSMLFGAETAMDSEALSEAIAGLYNTMIEDLGGIA